MQIGTHQRTLVFACALTACAAPKPAPEPPPPAVVASAGPAEEPKPATPDAGESEEEQRKRLAAELDKIPMTPIGALAGSGPAPLDYAQQFLAAANTDDDARAQALCSSVCWAGECGSFAKQAGKKFQARTTGAPRESGTRAVVGADVICPGDKKCDFVHLLLERHQGGFRVADITEDDAKAQAWVPK